MTISHDLVHLATMIEKAGDCEESHLLARLQFEDLWDAYKKKTQPMYDAYRLEAQAEFELEMARDLRSPARLEIVKARQM